MAPLTSHPSPASAKLSVPKPIEMVMLPPQGNSLIQLLSAKQSSRNISALQALGPRNTNLGLEEQRLPAGVHWFPCTGSCLALTCLCCCWEAAEPSHCPSDPVPAHKPLVSNSLDVWELWASVSACGGSGEGLGLPGRSSSTGRHVQLNILPFFSSQRKKRLEEILCCA